MKAEHVNAIVRFIRRVQPADLILPAGAALISAGLQRLVDREDRQRARLRALDELVGLHVGALAEAGVVMPTDLMGDELHPLDIESALQTILARTPSEPPAAEDQPRPRRRRTVRGLAVLGLAGGAGVTMWARGYARAYGQEPTVLGFLTALRGPVSEVSSNSSVPNSSEPDDISRSAVPHSHRYASDLDSVCESCGEKSRPSPAGPPAAEGVIGHGEPPLEECGWSGCEWTSDATRSELSQRTAAAVHRNRCVHRPAGAMVAE